MSPYRFEYLPPEIWLHIFDYLSSFDLFHAFADINNVRTQDIVFSRSLALNARTISYSKMKQIFSTPRYLILLRTVTLDNSLTSQAFYAYWTRMISPIYITPNIERLIIHEAEYYMYTIIDDLLKPLSVGSSLRCIHLFFVSCNMYYTSFLEALIRSATSFHTMILEVEHGM